MFMLTKEERKQMIDKYPFLYPRWLNGKKIENYNYEYCELDTLPQGWINSWILKFFNDIKFILIEKDLIDEYFIVRMNHRLWKSFEYKANIDIPEIDDLVKKYSSELDNYCIFCGKKPKYRSTWGFYACLPCARNDFYETQAVFDDEVNWEDEYEDI